MSGVEVIGLLLGIFPLVISALEHYTQVRKATALVCHVATEYRKALNEVKDQQLFFRYNLDNLLLPLTASGELEDGDLEALLADLSNPKWKSADVAEALERRLGHTYERFFEIVNDFHSLLSRLLLTLVDNKPELQERIQREGGNWNQLAQSPPKRLSALAWKTFVKRQWRCRKEQVELGVGAPHRRDILKSLDECNRKLERFLKANDKIAQFKESKTTKSSPKAVKGLLQYGQHADRIHTLIRQSFGCSCREKHCAHLWLQHHTSPSFEFKLLLLWAPRALRGEQLPPWDRQGLLITWTTMPRVFATSSIATQTNQTVSNTSTAIVTKSQNSKKRRVGFADLLTGPSSSLNTAPALSVPASITGQRTDDDTEGKPAQEIFKLCDTMSVCGMQPACIGALNDHEAGRQYSVFSQPEQKVAGDEITLYDILHGPQKRKLKRADRFQIALATASSHLQLHSTPWARRQWQAGDIRFPVKPTSGQIFFDKPYVAADFNAVLDDEDSTPTGIDRSFACLGIMLLELLFGACLDDHELWQQFGQDNKSINLFRLMVAKEWAEEVEKEAGSDYAAAVLWCLKESPITLEGEQWRSDLADRVVLPIQNCCGWIQPRPSGENGFV